MVRHLWPSSDGNRGIRQQFSLAALLAADGCNPMVVTQVASVVRFAIRFPLGGSFMPTTATTEKPTFIDPARMYSLRKFVADSGISLTRIRGAARQGIELPKVRAGKRVFVRGVDGIEFIEKLADACRPVRLGGRQ